MNDLLVVLPVLVLPGAAGHALLVARTGTGTEAEAGAETAALVSRIGGTHLALTPSGRPPREGPGSHPAVDRRHGPDQPAIEP